MAELDLRFCVRAFFSCGKRGPLFIAVRGPLTIAASPVAEHRLQTRRLSNCGSRAHLLRGMWDPPRPGLEPVSPALAGRFLTTAPPGKPSAGILDVVITANSTVIPENSNFLLCSCFYCQFFLLIFTCLVLSLVMPFISRKNLRNNLKLWMMLSLFRGLTLF